MDLDYRVLSVKYVFELRDLFLFGNAVLISICIMKVVVISFKCVSETVIDGELWLMCTMAWSLLIGINVIVVLNPW